MTRASSRRLASTRGFTLLELLIATAVGAVVLLVIQTTYFAALRLHNTTHERIDQDLEQQRAFAIIRRDIAGLMLPSGAQSTATLAGPFQSEDFSTLGEDYGDRVTPDMFTTTGRIDAYNPFSEVQKVAYYLQTPTAEDGADVVGRNLVRVVTRNLLPVQETPDGDEQVILSGVEDATVSFFDGTTWTDVWDSTVTSTMPRAIRFSITLAVRDSNQPQPAPIDLVVPVPAMTTTSQREEEEAAGAGEP